MRSQLQKDNDDLLKKMNEALASLKESGKIDEIVAKYILLTRQNNS